MPPQIVPSDRPADSVSCDVLVVPAWTDDGTASLSESGVTADRALGGQLSEHLHRTGFKANVGDVAMLPTLGRLPAAAVAAVGTGSKEAANATAIRRAAGAAARKLADRSSLASALHEGAGDGGAEAAAEGYLLGSYRFVHYKSDPRGSKIQEIISLGVSDVTGLERARAVADATNLARDLTNEPPSAIYPETLAERAREVADVAGLRCTIYDERRLADEGFGGILGVARGSDKPPRFIDLRYTPSDARGKIVLAGKGITFDSGGLSLKDAKGMETMKTDMAGAAAVIAAMSAIGKLRPSVEVIALVPASENMPGGRAIKPGDVIRHYGGKTSEVLNTDAEGRLVLADTLAFAAELSPDVIIDAATLTGGCMIALGRKVAGLFASDDALADEVIAAADTAGERVWRLPLQTEYRSDIDSEVADIKNTGTRYGSPIFGALFLRDFVPHAVPWAHLDIAGPARAESDYEEIPRGGTGFATRTMISFVEGRAR